MDKILTIAIPTYNAGENLLKAVKSCKNIKLPKDSYEILVVDNCSTDNSISMLENIKDDFPNLVIFRNQRNIGRVPNWNRCLELATGKYIIFLFSNDEIVEENEIEKKIEIAERESAIMVFCPYFYGDKLYDTSDLIMNCASSIAYKYALIEHPVEMIRCYINKFSFPFAPIQKSIYNLRVIKYLGLRFKPEFSEINCDQLFSIELLILSSKLQGLGKGVVLYKQPHLHWNFTGKRFHANIALEDVIRDDIKLLSMLAEDYGLEIDKARASFHILYRIFRDRGWKNSNIFKRFSSLRFWLYYIKKEKKLFLAYKYCSYALHILTRKLIKNLLRVDVCQPK